MNKAAAALLLLLAACQTTQGTFYAPQRLATRQQAMPEDVVDYMERRTACGSFRNDAAFGEREDFMADQSRLYCTGTTAELNALRAKYANNAQVWEALRDFEANL